MFSESGKECETIGLQGPPSQEDKSDIIWRNLAVKLSETYKARGQV
jgi:hypothetical protein